MRSIFVISILLSGTFAPGQVSFKTEVKQSIEVGETFNVQYVLEGASRLNEFARPQFPEGIRVINGPERSEGSAHTEAGPVKIINTSFILTAERAGTFIIPGAIIRADEKIYKSGIVKVNVRLPQPKQSSFQGINDAYFLAPGEDPQEKIRHNLFMKVQVNRKTCFVGEPVVATFKLYSRLESRSDIVKNPGFYGFTVQDMVALADKEVKEELVGGKRFDVHTVRKVQLYPLQAGSYTIDPMEVLNKVTFSRSIVSKKPEQEITEGVGDFDKGRDVSGTMEFESIMHTEPVTIAVKELPAANQPDDFSGGTGRFRVNASLVTPSIARNEEGLLRITVSGKGNFIQMAAPVIEWPSGIEGFEPSVKDSLDHLQAPLTGSRTFLYRFVSARSGEYQLPSTHFSFFDPDTNRYKTVSTPPLLLKVDNRDKALVDTSHYEKQTAGRGMPVNPAYLWLTLIVSVVIIAAIVTWRKENRKIREAKRLEAERPKEKIPLATFLHQANILQGADDRTFFTALRQSIWNFFRDRFELEGSRMSKPELYAVMKVKNVDAGLQVELIQVLDQCDAGIFTDVMTESDRETIFTRTKNLLEQLDNS